MKLNGTVLNRREILRDNIPGIKDFRNLKSQAPNIKEIQNFNIQGPKQVKGSPFGVPRSGLKD
jgi:hypothetical protein